MQINPKQFIGLVWPLCEQILKDKEISYKAKGIAIYLATQKAVNGQACSVRTLLKEKLSPDRRDAVYSGIRELKNNGYIQQIKIKDKKQKFTGIVYEFKTSFINCLPFRISNYSLKLITQALEDPAITWKAKGMISYFITLGFEEIKLADIDIHLSRKTKKYAFCTGLKELVESGYMSWKVVNGLLFYVLKKREKRQKNGKVKDLYKNKNENEIWYWDMFAAKY